MFSLAMILSLFGQQLMLMSDERKNRNKLIKQSTTANPQLKSFKLKSLIQWISKFLIIELKVSTVKSVCREWGENSFVSDVSVASTLSIPMDR